MKKKALCPFCKSEDDTQHIFEVDTDEEITYCPICGKKIHTQQAVDFYVTTIRGMVRKANYQAHIAGKFEKAYRSFGDILVLQNDNPFALTGRALSLLLMSTLRYDRFDDVLTLIDLEKHELRKAKNQITYFEFLSRSETILNIYLDNIKPKLSYKNYFYDEECLTLYFQHVYNAWKLEKFILSEMMYLNEKGLTNSRVCTRIDECNDKLKYLEGILTNPLMDIEGISYKINDYKAHMVVVKNDGAKIDTKVGPYVKFSLTKNNKKTHIISDRVFKARRIRFIICWNLILGASFFFICAILFLILALTLTNYFLPFMITFGISLGLSIIALAVRLSIKSKIKKTKLLNNIVEF